MAGKKSNSPNIRINKVYTRTGDGGKTRIVGGEKFTRWSFNIVWQSRNHWIRSLM